MNISIFVPWDGPSMNKLWSGVHWAKRKKWANEAHLAVAASAPRSRLTPPVGIEYTPVLGKGKRGFDCSNYAVICKAIEDGLVHVGVIPDDTPEYVHWVKTNKPVRGEQTGMRVEVIEIECANYGGTG